MVHYHFTPLHRHFDNGFGATAEAFKRAADQLLDSEKQHKHFNAHFPINFLYRHAIELFLKSLIVIVHKRLKLPYNNDTHESIPKIRHDSKWKPFQNIHSISMLYSYFKILLKENNAKLDSIAKSDWSVIPAELDGWISTIEQIDSTSTFFRYPAIKDRDADKEKSSSKESCHLDVFSKMWWGEKYTKALFVLNDNHEIVDTYEFNKIPLKKLQEALRNAAEMLSVAHFGMRHELAEGF